MEEWESMISKYKETLFQARVTYFSYTGKVVFECHLK